VTLARSAGIWLQAPGKRSRCFHCCALWSWAARDPPLARSVFVPNGTDGGELAVAAVFPWAAGHRSERRLPGADDGANIGTSPPVWVKLTFAWAIFFVVMGRANPLCRVHLQRRTPGVNFKLFGLLASR